MVPLKTLTAPTERAATTSQLSSLPSDSKLVVARRRDELAESMRTTSSPSPPPLPPSTARITQSAPEFAEGMGRGKRKRHLTVKAQQALESEYDHKRRRSPCT